MKRLLLVVALLCVLPAWAGAQGQPVSQDDLKKRKAHLLQEPFLKKGPWILDYDQALAAAKKSGKPIFAYFTRSYAD